MKINFVRLQNFRNVEFAEVPFDAPSVWISGSNAQGKTNLLESVGMLAALRSFRTSDMKALIYQGQTQASILAEVEHETQGKCEVQIEISDKRKVFVDGEEIKYTDYIGKFPALAICSEDIRILRGTPEIRRKEIDMLLSSIDKEYLVALKRYHATMSRRNALLKEERPDPSVFDAFEYEMANSASVIANTRELWLPKLGELATSRYETLARENGESATLKMKSSCTLKTPEDFREMFKRERHDDTRVGITRKGPHRDDFKITIADKDAKLYASEGQQRSAVLAIKLGEFELQKRETSIEPVILCDDILGELDASRRAAFWDCIPQNAQVLASATTPAPQDGSRKQWKNISVKKGAFVAL